MSPSREPGWYTDSADPSRERWWDGGEWSHVTRAAPERPQRAERFERARPAPPQAPPPAPPGPPQGPAWGSPEGRAYGSDPYGPPGQYAQWRPGVPTGPTTPDGVPLAGLGARLVARILDYVITTGIAVVVGLPSLLPVVRDASSRFDATQGAGGSLTFFQVWQEMTSDPRLYTFAFVSLAVSALYTIVLVRTKGGTVGKLVLGVRVRAWDVEGLPTWSQSAVRWATREAMQQLPLFGLLYWLVDSCWPLRDPRRQALHDKLPKTVVVRAR